MNRSIADDLRRSQGGPSPAGAVSFRVDSRRSIGSGRPLDGSRRREMEGRLGHDFRSVRIHDGSEAAAAARSLDAKAFTAGDDIVLGAGQRASGALLAHELTHVVQQRAATSIEPRVSGPGENSERAARMHSPGRFPSVPAVQRDPVEGAGSDFRLKPSPWFQRSMGRLVIDNFPLGKSTLTADQKDRIKLHASMLKTLLEGDPGARVTVTGHGDAVGTDERNIEVGRERAEKVTQELVAAGIPPGIIDVDSAGKSEPAVASKGAEGENRRAVVGFSPALRLPGLGVPKLTPPKFDFNEPPPKIDLGVGPRTKPKFEMIPKDTIPEDKPGPGVPEPPTFDWHQAEENMKRAREIEKRLPKDNRSINERLGDAVAQVFEPLIKKLPVSDSIKKKIREAIKDGVASGTEKGCEAAIDASGLTGEAAEGAKATCKAVLKSGGSK